MKRILALLLAAAVCLSLLTGCGTTPEPKIDDMPNPVKEYSTLQEQIDAVGLGLAAPEGASEVVYHSIEGMAETMFTYNGVPYFYRAEPTGEFEAYDMSGLHYEWTQTADSSVADRAAKVQLCAEAGFIMWLDVAPGINYNLGTSSAASAEQLTELANVVFVPTQGEPEIEPGLPWDAEVFDSCAEQALAAGFGLEAPAGAENVSYQLISGSIVQTLFKLDGVEYFYRAQSTGSTKAFDISGLYYDWSSVSTAQVIEREATVKLCDEAGFIMWLDVVPGINYNLGTSSKIEAEKLTVLAETVFMPVQENPGIIGGMKNPVKTFSSLDGQKDYVGFGLEAPEGAEDVYYQAIGSMAQTLFTLDGVSYFFRAEPSSSPKEYDMSGLHYTWKITTTDMLDDIQTVTRSCDEAGFIMWLDAAAQINYNLGTTNGLGTQSLFALAEKVFERIQKQSFAGMANPVQEHGSAAEQEALTGVGLEAPKEATDPVYLTIKGLTETRFTLDGTTYSYRAQPTKSPAYFDISGLYYEWTQCVEATVHDLPAYVSLCDEAGFVMWLDKDNGINYCLSVVGAASAEQLIEAADLAYKPFGAEDEPIINMKNPRVLFDSQQMQSAALGYGLKAPEGATDVRHYGLGTMAETIFTLNGVQYFFRTQPTSSLEAEDISGLYFDWTDSIEGTVQDKAATAKLCEDAAFVMWLDIVPGMNYNLGTASKLDAAELFALAEEIFEPLQGTIGGMESPVRGYDSADDQFAALGFSLLPPENAADAHYQSINGMAETVFTLDGAEYYYRAEPTGALECYDMSGIYADEWTEPAPCSVKGRDGKLICAGDAVVVMWFDAVVGFNYNLSVVSGADSDAVVQLAEEIFKPLQGENEGDEEEEEIAEFSSLEEQAAALGFGLAAPEKAEKVRYQSVNKTIAQTVFELDGVEYTYRAEATDKTESADISKLFKDDDPFETAEASVQERPAVVRYSEKTAVVLWLDIVPGVNYNLFSQDVTDTEALVKLAEEIFVPLQGEVNGD